MEATKIIEIVGMLSLIYSGVIYFLPPKYAKKLKPIGKILRFFASTPGGLKFK